MSENLGRIQFAACSITFAIGCSVTPALADSPDVARLAAKPTAHAKAAFTRVPTTHSPLRAAPISDDRAWLLENKANSNQYFIQHVGRRMGPAIVVPGLDDANKLKGFEAAGDDMLWLSTDSSVNYWNGKQWGTVPVPDYQGVKATTVGAITVDSANRLHVAATYLKPGVGQAIAVHRLEGSTWTTLNTPPFKPSEQKDVYPSISRLWFAGDRLQAAITYYRFGTGYNAVFRMMPTDWTELYVAGAGGHGGAFSSVNVHLPQRPEYVVRLFGANNATPKCVLLNVDTKAENTCPAPTWFEAAVALDDERIVTAGSKTDANQVITYGFGVRATPTSQDGDVPGPPSACRSLSRARASTTVWCMGLTPTDPGTAYRATFTR